MMQTQPFTIEDFSLGITDHYVDGDPRSMQTADNLLITDNKKLASRPGSEAYDEAHPQLPLGIGRVNQLYNYDSDTALLAHSGQRMFVHTETGWGLLAGPNAGMVFDTNTTTAHHASITEWNKHIYVVNASFSMPQKIYRDENGVWQVREAGLPYPNISATTIVADETSNTEYLADGVTPNPNYDPSLPPYQTYLYAFIFRRDYKVDTVAHSDYGPPSYFPQVIGPGLPISATNTVQINGLPSLPIGRNHDYINTRVDIYRTINGGTVFYKVGSVFNGDTTFVDNMDDPTLQTKEILYTAGDVVDNAPPPPAKYVHASKDFCWYAHIKHGNEIHENRILQSIAGDPDSVPEDFYVDVEGEITGLSSVSGVPIVLCKRGVYRIEGTLDELGRGFMSAQKISDTASCVSHLSICQTMDGIFWAGADGFYYSDGFKVMKISDHLNRTYKSLVMDAGQASRIIGAVDSENQRVWWGVQRNPASLDNDSFFILDLRWGLRPDSTFTTASGGENFSTTAVKFFRKELIRGDRRGYVFKHRSDLLSDPEVNTLVANVSTWKRVPIIPNYVGPALDMGTKMYRKWVPKMTLALKNVGDVTVQINSNNDDSGYFRGLAPISYRGAPNWGDPAGPQWGTGARWNFRAIIEEIRRFPAGGLRCMYKQIQITSGLSTVQASEGTETALVNASARSVFLSSGSWAGEIDGYFIRFSFDDYRQRFRIISRSPDTLMVEDPAGNLRDGNWAYLVQGYPPTESLHLLSYTIHFAPLSKSQKPYQGGGIGGNAAWNS